MKRRNLYLCSLIMMLIYLLGTLSYYSQIYIMENYYEGRIITSFLSGWNYLAQAVGMIIWMMTGRRLRQQKRMYGLLSACVLLGIPILALSATTTNAILRITAVLANNVLIGFLTALAFQLITAYVEKKRVGICFAIAYSLGGIGTWIISRCNVHIMSSIYVLLPYSFLCLITAGLLFIILKKAQHPGETPFMVQIPSDASADGDRHNYDAASVFLLSCVIILMALLTALGSNDSILAASGNQIDFLTTRIYYAGGLMLAGLLFDYSPALEGICTIGALLYPMMAIILYREFPGNMFVIGLTDTFTAFFAVWRAGSFMRIGSAHPDKRWISSLGLCVSRIAEGCAILLLCILQPGRLISFLSTGVLFAALLILSFLCMRRQFSQAEKEKAAPSDTPVSRESRRVFFAEQYQLTRREEEIVEYLAENKTNGEIAAILNLSESTVRFHVSNILKKTGLKNRNEVARAYFYQ